MQIVSWIAGTAAFLALLAVVACSSTGKLFERTPTATEELEGNYRTLAACTLDRLARQPYRLRRSDEQNLVRLIPDHGEWEMSFVNDGSLTRLEMKSAGGQASDYAVAIARACAA